MNPISSLSGLDLWPVAGWTMVHFLWLGALVGLAAGACRLALRRAPAGIRYAAALVCLAILAAMPLGIAAWVGSNSLPTQMVEVSVVAPTIATTPAARGSAGGETAATPTIQPLEIAPTTEIELAPAVEVGSNAEPDSIPNSRQSRGLSEVAAIVVRYLPWLWLVGSPLTFLLLATGVIGAERLRRASRPITSGPITETAARLAAALRISRRVTVAVCERIAAPVLVGIVRPLILLPPAAVTGWSPDEIEMVLLHELAHVRRWDNLVNLIQRGIESLLFFHPAVWLVSTWVRREREACCDQFVVGRTNRPHAYAELLVALAAQMPRSVLFHPTATTAMAAGPLRNRIRRILQMEDDPMLISGKSLAVVMSGLLLAATLVALNLPGAGGRRNRPRRAPRAQRYTASRTNYMPIALNSIPAAAA